jgi:hypothetical protein
MALVQYGSLVVGLKGKLGGHVFQSNRKGNFVRTNVKPRANNTLRGFTVRNNMSLVSALWQSITGARKALWAAECSNYTFYNRFNVAFTPNAYQLFTYAQLQFASLGLALIDTIPVGGTVANIVSSVSDVDTSTNHWLINLSSVPWGPYYTVIRVSNLSNSGNELNGASLKFFIYLRASVTTTFDLYSEIATYFGSLFKIGQSFITEIETIRYSGFAPGAKFSQIINIV